VVATARKGTEGIAATQPLQCGEGANPNPTAHEDSEGLTVAWAGGLPSVASNVDEVCPGTRTGTGVEQSLGQRAWRDATGAVTAVGAP